MEFQEVIRQKKRMCQSTMCCECDIYRLCGEDLFECQRFINNNPKKAEEIIMSWAAEHPAQVYPTWGEYLCDIGLIGDCTESEDVIFRLFNNVIPADIAQKLGIEPKEG